jgi:hypothetical protein
MTPKEAGAELARLFSGRSRALEKTVGTIVSTSQSRVPMALSSLSETRSTPRWLSTSGGMSAPGVQFVGLAPTVDRAHSFSDRLAALLHS